MYPKWVSRGHGMGQILCLNAEDEAAVHADREARENPAPVELVVQKPKVAAPEFTQEEPYSHQRKKPGPKPKVK